jgi:hypothetical protein
MNYEDYAKAGFKACQELTKENEFLKAKILKANKILDAKELSIARQVDEDGCPYEHLSTLTQTEKQLRACLNQESHLECSGCHQNMEDCSCADDAERRERK